MCDRFVCINLISLNWQDICKKIFLESIISFTLGMFGSGPMKSSVEFGVIIVYMQYLQYLNKQMTSAL